MVIYKVFTTVHHFFIQPIYPEILTLFFSTRFLNEKKPSILFKPPVMGHGCCQQAKTYIVMALYNIIMR